MNTLYLYILFVYNYVHVGASMYNVIVLFNFYYLNSRKSLEN